MNASIERFFSEHVESFVQALAHFDLQIDRAAQPESDLVTQELTQCINASLAECSELERRYGADNNKELKEVQARYRQAIRPWFDKSWFMRRALEKPRGYPGDYELLTAIYDGRTKACGLGGYLDRYFLNTTLGRAVPARMRAVRRFLLDEIGRREGSVAVLNVACGSCREFTEGFDFQRPAVQITCLDNDSQALDYVRTNVAPVVMGSVALIFVRYNALRMTSATVNRERFGRSDIIYSVGLCDYLPDQYLVPMLKAWRESLHEQGVVYVAFKDMKRYDKAEYQWLVDWFFYQRTEEECRQLFDAAGYDMDELDVSRDETGVILNFAGRNKAAASIRIDEAQELEPSPPRNQSPVTARFHPYRRSSGA